MAGWICRKTSLGGTLAHRYVKTIVIYSLPPLSSNISITYRTSVVLLVSVSSILDSLSPVRWWLTLAKKLLGSTEIKLFFLTLGTSQEFLSNLFVSFFGWRDTNGWLIPGCLSSFGIFTALFTYINFWGRRTEIFSTQQHLFINGKSTLQGKKHF